MLDDSLGHVRELVPGEEHVARPFKILSNGSRGKWMIVPDAEPYARTHVVKGADPMTIRGRHPRERVGRERSDGTGIGL